MAIVQAILSPLGGGSASTPDITAALAATTSTGEIVLNRYTLFAFNATTDMNIRFGNAGMPAASATDYRIPANTIVVYQIPAQYDRMRVFNPTAGSGNYFIQPLRATL